MADSAGGGVTAAHSSPPKSSKSPSSPPRPETGEHPLEAEEPVAAVEVDLDLEDNDSAFGDQLSTYTSSLASSALNYPIEHGRRHTVGAFLDAGFRVRGTVRSAAKGGYLKNLFRDKASPFEYCIVKDISEPGAFDEAVEGVDGVAHMASPFHGNADEPAELFVPAVEGTTGILKSLEKNCPGVKRVVVTSSNAAVTDPALPATDGPLTFTEKDWNESSVGTCKTLGRKAPAMEKYKASKVLAERAFWEFFKDDKPQFDGVAINPPMVYGPPIHECPSADQLNTSCSVFYQWQLGKTSKADLAFRGSWVDVRDCAQAHVRALTTPEASMQRFIVSGGSYCADDFCLALHKLYPSATNIIEGDPTAHDRTLKTGVHIDGSKAEKVLGIKYTTFDKCLADMAHALEARYGM